MPKVLVVDDDPSLQRALSIGLTARGYEVTTTQRGEEAIHLLALEGADVMVLDLGLPDLDGIEVCRRIRSFTQVPIVVLSAAGEEARKVAVLDAGADDFVTKPFSMAELEARLRVALRHRPNNGEHADAVLRFGRLEVDAIHHMAAVDGVALDLTSREFDLLHYLARHAGKVCTHHMILAAVWGPGYGAEAHYLRVYAHRLRKKLGPEVGHMLHTQPGIGYQLIPEDAAS